MFFVYRTKNVTLNLLFGTVQWSTREIPSRPKINWFLDGMTLGRWVYVRFLRYQAEQPQTKFCEYCVVCKVYKIRYFKIFGGTALDSGTQTSRFRDENPVWLHVAFLECSKQPKVHSTSTNNRKQEKKGSCAVWKRHPSPKCGTTHLFVSAELPLNWSKPKTNLTVQAMCQQRTFSEAVPPLPSLDAVVSYSSPTPATPKLTAAAAAVYAVRATVAALS